MCFFFRPHPHLFLCCFGVDVVGVMVSNAALCSSSWIALLVMAFSRYLKNRSLYSFLKITGNGVVTYLQCLG